MTRSSSGPERKVGITMATKAVVTSRPRPQPLLPVLVMAASAILIAAGLATYWRGWGRHVPVGYGADLPALLATELFAASATAIGFIVARRKADCAIARLLLLLGLAAAAIMLGLYTDAATAGEAMVATRGAPALGLHGWLAGAAMQPAMGGLTGLLMFVFPDGHLPSRAWRAGVAVLIVGMSARFVEVGLLSDRVPYLPTLDNPFSVLAHGAGLPATGQIEPGLVALMAGMALAAASLVVRYRGAGPEVRRPIRSFAIAGAVLTATLVPLWHLFVFVDPLEGRGQDLWVAFFLAASLFPVVVGLAVTRNHLWQLDRLVSRAFVHGATTAIVAGLFSASIGLSQRLFVAVTGETSDAAIVLTTLVAAAAYTPIRRRLETVADRFLRYEEPRLGSYGQSLRDVLALLDPDETAQHMLSEVIRELGATGGWVELEDGSIGASTQSSQGDGPAAPPVAAAIAVPVPSRAGIWGRLVVGPRLDSHPYRAEDLRVIEEAARLLGRALDLQATSRRPAMPDPDLARERAGCASLGLGEPLAAAPAG